MAKHDTVVISFLVMVCLCWLPETVKSLGGNNIFGFFRKRRQTLYKTQKKLEAEAIEEKAFSGPNGKLVNSTETASLESVGSWWNPVADWFSRK
jgi:hypothetical protein